MTWIQNNWLKVVAIAMLIASASAINMRAAPVANVCTNANKATGEDQDCSTPGNSAWNTHTTARTDDPRNAQKAPYPDHTLH